MRATPRRHLPAVVPGALTGLPFDLSHLRDAATPLGGPIESIDAPQPSPYDVGLEMMPEGPWGQQRIRERSRAWAMGMPVYVRGLPIVVIGPGLSRLPIREVESRV